MSGQAGGLLMSTLCWVSGNSDINVALQVARHLCRLTWLGQ